MKHHKSWQERNLHTMRDLKAVGGLAGTFSTAGTKGNQAPGLDSKGLTVQSGTKEQGVKVSGKKSLGGPM